MGHYPNTALVNNKKKNSGAGEWPKLFRENNSKKQGCVVVAVSPCFWQIFPTGCFFDCPVDRSWCALARSAAATELRRSRCCDGVAAATESLLRGSRCCDGDAQNSSVALILRVASRRDALNEEPASFSLLMIQISSRGPQS